MTSKLVAAIAIAVTLALWAHVVGNAYRSRVDIAPLHGQITQLSRAENAAMELDAALANAHLEWDSDVPRLSDAEAAWVRQQQLIRNTSAGSGAAATIRSALARHTAASKRMLDGVDSFREIHANLIKEFGTMRAAGKTAVQSSAVQVDSSLSRTIVLLMEEVASYCLQASPGNRPTIETLLARLDNENMSELGDRIRLVMAIRDQQQSLLDELTAQPLAPTVAAISSGLLEQRLDQAQEAHNNVVILAVFGSGLLLVFGLIGLRLRASLAELDGVNANLERLVEQRTAELNAALEDIKQQQLQLVQSEKMASLGQMAAGVAHEINTPLGYSRSNIESVRDWIDTLTDPELDSEERQEMADDSKVLLQDTLHGIETISHLVESLKNFSRVDRSSAETADIHACIDSALEFSRRELQDGVAIEKDYGELPKVDCFPSKLNQVFLNLIRNAAEAMDKSGTLSLATRAVEGGIEISIKDTGSGMPPETIEHIFEPFYTTKPVGQGTGMGLSEAYQFIEEHGGHIRVRSSPGEGAEFVIELPLRPPVVEAVPAVSREADEPDPETAPAY